MNESMVRQAAEEFARGNFPAALDFYKRLSAILGERYFRANIHLCERRIDAETRLASEQISLGNIKVACVMDEFTFASYKDTCTLLNLSLDNWQAEIEEFQPDILFIESAWRGKDDGWNRKISRASPELLGVLEWCDARKIATMFWNKEDPVHYGTFLNTAKLFSHVFTTDIGCIPNYKKDLGHDRVYLLPFACNPVEHNPIEKYQRKAAANFAGSFYVRYPERARDLDTLLGTFVQHSGVEIYDRQYGKGDQNYAFPEKYLPLILGNLKYEEIDVAYKGYQYGINLNSVKYSSTMFARRVYELLACNTLVVSNYSQGVRLLFGELVVSSDDKVELSGRIDKLNKDDSYRCQIKLAGLRKVMTEHTYEHRFSYVAEKLLGRKRQDLLPTVHVLAVARSAEAVDSIVTTFRQFNYEKKNLIVVVPSAEYALPAGGRGNERVMVGSFVRPDEFGFVRGNYLALLKSENRYAENYLTDLAIATKYSTAKVIAKGSFPGGRLPLGAEYSYGSSFYPDASLVAHEWVGAVLSDALSPVSESKLFTADNQGDVFYIDGFSFIPAGSDVEVDAAYVGKCAIDDGINIADVFDRAEKALPAADMEVDAHGDAVWHGSRLAGMIDLAAAEKKGVTFTSNGNLLRIDIRENATLPYYAYVTNLIRVEDLWADRSGKLYVDTTPGLELSAVVIFFDAQKNRLSHAIPNANWNQTANIPADAVFVRFGIRVAGSSAAGQAAVKRVIFHHTTGKHQLAWVPSSKHLLITPNYPEYGDYYRYGFVHRRVKSYKDRGLAVDVFRFKANGAFKLYEFENIDVIAGSKAVLERVLSAGSYSSIAIHALGQDMWELVSKYVDNTKIVVWLHGAEIQSWKRRAFNYQTPQELAAAKANGDRRDEFWKMLFGLHHPNIHFVFVSHQFYQEVKADLGVSIKAENLRVIHNPIDGNLFTYERKLREDRKKILSIRPYASRVYANDLTVRAIMELSVRPFFDDLKFLLVGDGALFDETVAPLRQFKNVEIRKGFISQAEIVTLHKQYGVFLCPSRMDTQGVSRDEAMASGLVPITNRVGAISEFVSGDAGFLCDEEDHTQLADSIERLYHDAELFMRMSEASAGLVRQNRSSELIAEQDIALIAS